MGVKRLAFVLCLAATGCGGGMPGQPGMPGGSNTGAELGSTIEASAAEMERELAALEGRNQAPANGGDEPAIVDAEEPAAEAGEPPPPPAAPPHADATATPTNEPEGVDEDAKKRDGCKTACRALASMKRTEARICDLVGESHDKCTWAHGRVKEATDRIERARCSCRD